jgi:hypothetical protein
MPSQVPSVSRPWPERAGIDVEVDVDDVRDEAWPRHPWIALVERYGDPQIRESSVRRRVVVVWWRTRAGSQPVILVVRRRLD